MPMRRKDRNFDPKLVVISGYKTPNLEVVSNVDSEDPFGSSSFVQSSNTDNSSLSSATSVDSQALRDRRDSAMQDEEVFWTLEKAHRPPEQHIMRFTYASQNLVSIKPRSQNEKSKEDFVNHIRKRLLGIENHFPTKS